MRRSKLKPTLEDAFEVGRLEGLKEAFSEILDLTQSESVHHLRVYLKSRVKSLNDQNIKNPFRRGK